jgi:hypothetical protein
MGDPIFIQSLVDIKQVSSLQGIALDGRADINIRPAVVIDIHYRDAAAPLPCPVNSGFFGDVVKFEVSPVQVQFIGYHIASEIDIGQAILVEISNPHTAPVINIGHIQGVYRIVFYDLVVEVNAGMIGRDQLK